MFWRAARGRVGPNSRSVLHMAIFLLNPYGLYACILIPKWLASSPERLASPPEMAEPACSPELSKLARKARTPLTCGRFIAQGGVAYASVRFAHAGRKRGTSSSRHHMAIHPIFLMLASLASNLGPEQCMPIKRKKK